MFFSGDPSSRKGVDLGGRSPKQRDRQKLLEQARLEREQRQRGRHQTLSALRIQIPYMEKKTSEVSSEEQEEEDEEDCEDDNKESRMVGFMFGNVDDFGELDVDYLDEDAKEHLHALADTLGPSLTDLEVSVERRAGTFSDKAEQGDYDQKAEDAVDYEDIEEEYDGPEVHAASEEDQVFPKDECFYAVPALPGTSNLGAPILDEDNYDEDEDYDNEGGLMEDHPEAQNVSPPEEHGSSFVEREISPMEAVNDNDNIVISEIEAATPQEEPDNRPGIPLPVLCKEDGKVVLRFSEIFGVRETFRVKDKKVCQRSSLLKGRDSALDNTDILEEDELSFLKSSQQKQGESKTVNVTQVEYGGKIGNSMEEVDSSHGQGICSSPSDEINWEGKKQHCLCAQPMKDEENSDTLLVCKESFPSSNFYALEQQDWEADIVWDSPALVKKSTSDEVDEQYAGPYTEEDKDTEGEETTNGCEHFLLNVKTVVEERERSNELHNHPVSVEPFGQKLLIGEVTLENPRKVQHPQMLRLESCLNSDGSHELDSEIAKSVKGVSGQDIINRLNKLSLQNTDIMEGSWVDRIVWDQSKRIARPRLILNLQDDQMLFEILDTKEGRHMRAHAAAMVIPRSTKTNSGELGELSSQGASSIARLNISNDRYYSNRKTSPQQKSHSKKRTVHGNKVIHSLPAMRLQTMKPKLSNKDLANFHRPKAEWYPHHNEVAAKEQGKLFAQGPMKIIVKSMGGKGSKLHVDAAETLESVKGKASKKLDLKPSERTKFLYSGKELQEGKSLAAQDVRPNSVLHLVRTKVHLWPKAQRLPGENKPVRPPGAFKKKSELSVKDGHVFLMEYCEERPLLLGNTGMGARLTTYYQKLTASDQNAATLRNELNCVGTVLPLEPTDKSPFLGDIRPGYSQSCLETNMYRAPVFPHKVASTDFLLVRSAKGKLSLRRIDRVYVVGQQEPHIEVLSPGSKVLQSYVGNRLLVYMYREFRATEKPGCLPRVRADELTAQFPNLSESFLRKRLKHCADLQKGPGGEMLWFMKRNFRIPSEEELRRMVTPENVCAYESMQAGLHHLKRLGINKLTQPAGLASAMNQLPDEAIALAAASHIERELQITSWNLSSNFVLSTMQGRECIERLEITGVGDPSGRGLGFSYLRVAPKPPISSALVKKKAAAARGGSAVTGTDADLRRLSMDAAREVLLKFNVDEEQIEKMTRWHRIAMVRKLSSEQAASGVKVDATALNKFARGQRMSFLQLQQQTREKCQEIWDRQFQSLSAADGEDLESDVEANSDLDSFAGDLENLLDAEEGEEGAMGDSAIKKEKREAIRGLVARRRASQAQAEEEIEDEAAEAAELCRMLMDDDEAEEQRKKSVAKKKRLDMPEVQGDLTLDHKADNAKKTKRVLKRIIRTRKPDGTVTSREVIITDPKEVAQYLAKKNTLQKGKKENVKNVGLKPLVVKKKNVTVKDSKKVLKVKKQKDKPVRDSFICGACGQSGHMRTNKKCPLYMEDTEVNVEKAVVELRKPENAAGEELSTNHGTKPKIKRKSVTSVKQPGIAHLEAQNVENVNEDNKLPAKVIPLKFKCGTGGDKVLDDRTGNESSIADGRNEFSEQGNIQSPQTKKAKLSKKSKKAKDGEETVSQIPGSMQSDVNTVQVLVHKQRSEVEKEHKTPKIVFKKRKEIPSEEQRKRQAEIEMEREKERAQQELREKEKLRKEEEEHQRRIEKEQREKAREDKRKAKELRKLQEEAERRREREEREREEKAREERRRREEAERQRIIEEAERQRMRDEIRRQQEAEKLKEREEFERLERHRAKQKQIEKVQRQREREMREEHGKANRLKRQDRRVPERERGLKRRSSVDPGRHATDHGQQTKRRRGGEVVLSNILEKIVDRLRNQTDVSYLFLKPVSKKEAPDYGLYVKHPMDLSTIKQKVRRLEYKSREEFRQDVFQIMDNAHTYNEGRNPGIPPLADQLLETCDDLLEEHDMELTEAESGVERFEDDPLYK